MSHNNHRFSSILPRRYWTYYIILFVSLCGFCVIHFPFLASSSLSFDRFSQKYGPIFENPKKFEKQKEVICRLHAVGGGGGLGNSLFEVLSFLGIARTLNRRPVLNVVKIGSLDGMAKLIYPTFPELIEQFYLEFRSVDNYTEVAAHRKGVCRFDDPAKFLDYPQEVLYLNGAYFQSFRYFHHIRSDVRRWLIPKQHFFAKADEKLPEKYRDDFVLCVHTRRGDFSKDTIHEPSNATFTRFATDFLVREYQKSNKNVTVIIMGNDLRWAYSVFQDKAVDVDENLRNITKISKSSALPEFPENSPVYPVIIKDASREVDLAFSRKYCDSVLITAPSSTFGWFLGYNSKTGHEVFYRNINETRDKVAEDMTHDDYYLPEWVMLETTKDGKIIKS